MPEITPYELELQDKLNYIFSDKFEIIDEDSIQDDAHLNSRDLIRIRDNFSHSVYIVKDVLHRKQANIEPRFAEKFDDIDLRNILPYRRNYKFFTGEVARVNLRAAIYAKAYIMEQLGVFNDNDFYSEAFKLYLRIDNRKVIYTVDDFVRIVASARVYHEKENIPEYIDLSYKKTLYHFTEEDFKDILDLAKTGQYTINDLYEKWKWKNSQIRMYNSLAKTGLTVRTLSLSAFKKALHKIGYKSNYDRSKASIFKQHIKKTVKTAVNVINENVVKPIINTITKDNKEPKSFNQQAVPVSNILNAKPSNNIDRQLLDASLIETLTRGFSQTPRHAKPAIKGPTDTMYNDNSKIAMYTPILTNINTERDREHLSILATQLSMTKQTFEIPPEIMASFANVSL